jgi:DNA-binding response OmpR family regulator
MTCAPAPRKTAILIVEDDANLRSLYRAALTRAGYAVVAVEDGVDALRHIERGVVPDVLLLDLELPRLAGRDLHRELQSHSETRGIPVIVVSGTDTGNLDHAAFACVLKKPVDVDDVISAVEKCLRKARRANNS